MSKINIEFNSVPPLNSSFTFTDILGGANIEYKFTYKNIPFNSPPVAGDVPWSNDLFGILNNTTQHFNQHYNNLLIYNVKSNSSNGIPFTVEIKSVNGDSFFQIEENTTNGAVDFTIANLVNDNIAINSVTISESPSDSCNLFNLRPTTTVQADGVYSPFNQQVSGNPFVLVDVPRDERVLLRVYKGGSEATRTYRVPKLIASYFDINVLLTPFGSAITVNRLYPLTDFGQNPLLLVFEYSFDGGNTFQKSNSQSGLPEGDYTIVVRDNIGCEISIDVSIDSFTPNLIDYDAISEISGINPLGFKVIEKWDSCDTIKNKLNTLSYEVNDPINPIRFKHLFQTCDPIPTQIKSNYPEHKATLFDCDAKEIDINVIKKTGNMNKIDIRDAQLYNETGKVQVIFDVGDTYDEVGQVSGTYNTNGKHMNWLNIGDYILIEGYGWAKIERIIAPDTNAIISIFRKYRIETNIDWSGTVFGTFINKITSYYNTVNYERYEFVIPKDFLSEGDYFMEFKFIDSSGQYQEKTHRSEWFNISENQDEEHHVINYYNSENNDINFATGIKFRLRIPYTDIMEWSPNTDQEVYVTDTRTITIENKVREFYTLTFAPVPLYIAQKLVLALSQDRLEIDGITYTLEGDFDILRLGITNLYQVSPKLTRSDYVFENFNGLTIGEVILLDQTPIKINDNTEGLLLL